MAEDKYLYEIEAIETMADEDRILILVGTKEYLITKADFVKTLGGLNSDDYAKIAKLVIDGSGTGLLADDGNYKSIANLFNTSQVTINVDTGLAEIAGHHTHLNIDILNKFTVNPETGELLYDGSPIGTGGGSGSTYELPVATTDTLGGVKVDNDTIKINDGVISADVIGNWASGVSYPVGYFVVHEETLYECITANNDTIWTEDNWLLIGGNNTGMTINNWTTNTEYAVGNLVINGTTIYQCNTAHTSGDTFDDTNWTAMTGAKGDKGEDGFSPIAKVVATETGATITITDETETTTVDITNGISPTVSIEQTETGATITVVSGEETTTVELTNGITPHIDETTKNWFVGETDTGVLAEAISTVITNAVVYTGTLAVDNWVGNTVPYTQEVAINGISEASRPYLYLSYSTDDADTILEEQKQWSYITRAVASDNIITFYCYKNKPTITLNFEAEVR